MNFIMIGLLSLREALDILCVRLNMYLVNIIIGPSFALLCQTTISLYHEDQDDDSRRLHNWHFDAAAIKSISHYRRNSRGVFLYVYENSDDFHIFFPSELHKQR